MLNDINLTLRCLCLNHNGSVQGSWTASANWNWIVDPLNGEKFIKVAEVQGTEIKVRFSYIFHVAFMFMQA